MSTPPQRELCGRYSAPARRRSSGSSRRPCPSPRARRRSACRHCGPRAWPGPRGRPRPRSRACGAGRSGRPEAMGAPGGKGLLGPATAASVSSMPAWGISAMTSAVAGSRTWIIRAPRGAGRRLPEPRDGPAALARLLDQRPDTPAALVLLGVPGRRPRSSCRGSRSPPRPRRRPSRSRPRPRRARRGPGGAPTSPRCARPPLRARRASRARAGRRDR